MATRCCQWGIDKWGVLRPDRQEDLLIAWEKLQKACRQKDVRAPKFSLRHLRNILQSWPAKAGLSIDL